MTISKIIDNGDRYSALSTDFPGLVTTNPVYRGAKIYFTDTEVSYVVNDRLHLIVDDFSEAPSSGGETSNGLTDTQLRETPVPTSIPGLLIPNKFANLNGINIGSIATVWIPVSGKRITLMGGSISVSAAVSILFEDNVAGETVIRVPKLPVDLPYNFDLANGVQLTAIDHVLKATSSGAALVTGYLYGRED